MTSVTPWRETLGLGIAKAPEVFTHGAEAVGRAYGWAIEHGLTQGVTAYLAVQGRPRAAIVARDDEDKVEFKRLWKMLWNQGLASVLVLHLPTQVKIYSLHEDPAWTERKSTLKHVLALESITEALECRQVLLDIQEGRFFEGDHSKRFKKSTRVDARLLGNLDNALKCLVADIGLTEGQGQALLLQVLFLAYLEDRKIIDTAYIHKAIESNRHENLTSILHDADTGAFCKLFEKLKIDFNGDVFQSPLYIGRLENIDIRQLDAHCLAALKDFREGRYDAKSGQFAFWPYDFSHIPVELLSAVYNRFMETDLKRRNQGVYYTPAFLAQACVDFAFDNINDKNILDPSYKILDPACGSAIFLVCVFQRLVDAWRKEHGKIPDWLTLLALLGRLHGWDKDCRALRVGLVSLYIALLEKMEPSAIEELRKQGKVLPKLLGTAILQRNFFAIDFEVDQARYGLVIGNPPWISRKAEEVEEARNWCISNRCLMPAEQIAWAFLWKSLTIISEDGQVALLLPATGVLFNEKAKEARQQLFETKKVSRIVNFADLCFQLFEGASAPAILLQAMGTLSTSFDYWVPKANPAFTEHRAITFTRHDRMGLQIREVLDDDRLLSRRAWGSARDVELLKWLDDIPRLGELVVQYGDLQRRKLDYPAGKLVIGQGFKPPGIKTPLTGFLDELNTYNFLNAEHKQRWVLPTIKIKWSESAAVHRFGFMDGFKAPHVILNQGVERSTGLLRAVYSTQNLCFQHTLQAIWSPQGHADANLLKVLAAIFNSRLAAWYLFHTSDNLGVERFVVRQHEYLDLPFFMRENSPSPKAYDRIITLMDKYADRLTVNSTELASEVQADPEFERLINEAVYDYYGLREVQRKLIDDAIQYIIPSNQPTRSLDPYPQLWDFPDNTMLHEYAAWLQRALKSNYDANTRISVKIWTSTARLYIIEIVWGENDEAEVCLDTSRAFGSLATSLLNLWPGGGLIQNMLDMALCKKNQLFLIRPARVRHFMASSALADSDHIIADLMMHTCGKIVQ